MTATATAIEHVDVLIVGAGISGVGGAYHLTTQRPGTSFVVLENQHTCLLYTSPSPRDQRGSRMPSSA